MSYSTMSFYDSAGTWLRSTLERAKKCSDRSAHQRVTYDDGSLVEMEATIEPDGTVVHNIRIVPRTSTRSKL